MGNVRANLRILLNAVVWACCLLPVASSCGDTPGAPLVEVVGDTGLEVGDLPGEGAPCAGEPLLGDPAFVVPSAGLPPEVNPQAANNNLDMVAHDDRYYLAFRSAPNHFASPAVVLYVVSSEDRVSWEFEAAFTMDTDLREPRFLSLDGELFLYFAVLGDSPFDFTPQGMMVTQRQAPGQWSEPEWSYLPGFIPWRARVVDSVPYLIGYIGGENIYDENDAVLEVHWLTTQDGRTFEPVIPGQPAVLVGGVSETDFAFLDDGTLVAVARNEEGDADGFGSKICRAAPDSLDEWECAADSKKYDSPLVFAHANQVYLVGRRNVTETGDYDLQRDDLPEEDRFLTYQLDYWEQPKRCALWRVHPDTLTVEFIADLPSAGDTCFPSILKLGPARYEIFNYTSPLSQPDISWLEGQSGATSIYRIRLEFACQE